MQTRFRLRPGSPLPLGATWDGRGTNFALYSENASTVDLCLFDAAGAETLIRLRDRTEFVWHAYVEGVGPGQLYGFRVDGPWEPARGLRFNPRNVLLDPYARALSGPVDWSKGAFSYDIHSSSEKDLQRATTDQLGAPRGVVIDPSFDWGDDKPPNIPMRRSVIYEVHVKGMSARHPQVPGDLRGTYSALTTEPILRHLRELGVTAVELLPVHGFVDDQFLLDRKLSNYWGYNTIAFFAPDVRFRVGKEVASEVTQFKHMVKALHAAGMEVILDVVYNHTAEGNHMGPTLSFKGIDNPTYYRLVPEDERYYFDYTGTGNTFNIRSPHTLRLLMDSLRYWVSEMHVDGFRFDLASTLARSLHEVDRLSSFFTVIHQDPILAGTKLIAEPWDVGEGGYQVGRFPVRWAEWNGKYRDTMRRFWRGDGGSAADLGYRLTGSSDLYERDGRRPHSSVNFVTAHDGFTLRDLVSYDHKHNEANGEENRDGTDDNASWNCGAEGETKDEGVLALRRRQTRNLLATVLLSQGTPMICGGDEIGRTQGGNNNAYCQDNEISWLDWELDDERTALLEFTRRLVRLRREHPLLQRASYFQGREIRGVGVTDVAWFRHDGEPMTDEDWSNPSTASLGMFMAGSGLDPVDENGDAQSDEDLVVVVNASGDDVDFILPAFVLRGRALPWTLLLDTADDGASESVETGTVSKVIARSLKVFERRALGPGGLQGAYGAPSSTYRLQLHPKFGFAEARALTDYLSDLGIGAVYASPYLRAQHDSTHGYDVVDHTVVNLELGTPSEHAAWMSALREKKMGHIVDFVPNHVGIGSGENRWWMDLLENGRGSVFADYFDVDWEPPSLAQTNKILLPVLGEQFGKAIDDRKIRLLYDGRSLWVTYYERKFPASPRSYGQVLERARSILEIATDNPNAQELDSVLASVRHLPSAATARPEQRLGRSREKEVIKRRIATLIERWPELGSAFERALGEVAQDSARLEEFLGEQNYRLSYWRVATEEINYRRFFDVNELAAIRMEDPEVFAATHGLILDLIAEGSVTGLRLDHTDGLYDPEAYFDSLQAAAREARRWGGLPAEAPIFVVVEKILETGESLPRAWSISGTTGYDYLSATNGLFVDPAGEAKMVDSFFGMGIPRPAFREVASRAKRDVMNGSFSSEVHVLGRMLKRLAERRRHARDFTLASLVRVIKETISAFSVYRTYVRPDGSREASDDKHIDAAIGLARANNPMVESTPFDFLRDVLTLRDKDDDAVVFAMRFQQITGPIMAKGIEDTAFYRRAPLASVNEVGCDGSRFATSAGDLHTHNEAILARWPLSMTTTTTHDTKRSEDVRSRLQVLSEIPDQWAALLTNVRTLVANSCKNVSAGDQNLFLQTLVGIFPFEGTPEGAAGSDVTNRLVEYMRKAIREAKVQTSWTLPNAPYEAGVEAMIHAVLDSPEAVDTVSSFVKRIAPYGAVNALAQLGLRLVAPGVPDVYQGAELWDLSLVDPDNRRPVDFARRRELLAQLRTHPRPSVDLARELVNSFTDGRIKLHVMSTGLRLRREMPSLFLDGAYERIEVSDHVVAFARVLGDRRLVCVVPRLVHTLTRGERPWPLGEVWGTTTLPLSRSGRFTNALTGETFEGDNLALSAIFACFPVAWLVEAPAEAGE